MGGPLPIPTSEVLAYCTLFEIDDIDERDELLDVIRALDRVYLDHMDEKADSV